MVIMTERQGLVVYLNSVKQAKALRKYGNVHYVSKSLKYAVLYCDKEKSEGVMNKLKSLPYVKKVLLSYKGSLKTEFENSRPDKAKEYDYKIGL